MALSTLRLVIDISSRVVRESMPVLQSLGSQCMSLVQEAAGCDEKLGAMVIESNQTRKEIEKLYNGMSTFIDSVQKFISYAKLDRSQAEKIVENEKHRNRYLTKLKSLGRDWKMTSEHLLDRCASVDRSLTKALEKCNSLRNEVSAKKSKTKLFGGIIAGAVGGAAIIGAVGSAATILGALVVGVATAGIGAPVVAAVGAGATGAAAAAVGGGASAATGVATHLKVQDYNKVLEQVTKLIAHFKKFFFTATHEIDMDVINFATEGVDIQLKNIDDEDFEASLDLFLEKVNEADANLKIEEHRNKIQQQINEIHDGVNTLPKML